jgi:hypothetical protein
VTHAEAVSAHLQSLLEGSASLVAIVGTAIAKGAIDEDESLPSIVHSIILAGEKIHIASSGGSDPRMGYVDVQFQLRADDKGDSYERCYAIIALAEAAILISSRQGDKTIYKPVPVTKFERERPNLGERYPSVIAEYTALVSQTVGVGV